MKSEHGILPVLIGIALLSASLFNDKQLKELITDRRLYWEKNGKAVLVSFLLIALGISMMATLEEI